MPKLVVPGRRADRLRGRLRQRAAHQGQPQRDAVRHAGGRARRRRARRRARATTSLPSYDDGLARIARSARDLWKVRNAKPLWSKLGTLAGIALGGLDMWTNTLGFSLFGTLGHGKPDFATLKPAAAVQADRLSEARRQAHLRPAVVGVSVQHQSRGGPAGRICMVARHGAAEIVRARRLCRAVGALLPGRRLRMGRGGRAARAS